MSLMNEPKYRVEPIHPGHYVSVKPGNRVVFEKPVTVERPKTVPTGVKISLKKTGNQDGCLAHEVTEIHVVGPMSTYQNEITFRILLDPRELPRSQS